MDHQEALEQLELAAVEPGGLERLMAGDTPTAAAIAGHLAGCAACADELERLRRAVPLLRDVVRTTPPADLRDRTLSFVRAHGEPRVGAAPPAGPGDRRRGFGALPWVAAIAAAVVISAVASAVVIGLRVDQRLADQDRAIAGLEAVTTATMEITTDPGALRVALQPVAGADASGTLLFSPASTRLVVVATGLGVPPAGQEYRCWVEVDGARRDVGRMYLAGDLSFWAGPTPIIADVPPGTIFGVSLTDLDDSGPKVDPVLVGRL